MGGGVHEGPDHHVQGEGLRRRVEGWRGISWTIEASAASKACNCRTRNEDRSLK